MSVQLRIKEAANLALSFTEKLVRASKGEKGIVEPTFVYLPGVPGGEAVAKETGLDYFSVPVELGVCLLRSFFLCQRHPNSIPAIRSPKRHKPSVQR